MIKNIKLSLISHATSSQINRQKSMCGERDSIRVGCNGGKIAKREE